MSKGPPVDLSEETSDFNRRQFLHATGGMSIVATWGVAGAIEGLSFDGTAPQFDDGDGTEANPYQISTVDQLQAIETELDAHYELASDVDASVTSTWNDGAGFRPLGDEDTPFAGTFEGQKRTIRGLTIDRPDDDHVGLFGKTDGATIRNIQVTSVSVAGRNRTGGLVGDLGASGDELTQSSTSGSVDGSEYVGGLVGKNRGSVRECWSDCTTQGTVRVGGLVGGNQVGSGIAKSYATGPVTGSEAVGGLFGGNQVATRITESYAVGRVTGETDIGGLVGHVDRSSITNSYWDEETTGQGGSAGDTDNSRTNYDGLTSDQMTGQVAQDNMEGFDFEKTWHITDKYPSLAWEQGQGSTEISGSDVTIEFENNFRTDSTHTFLAGLYNEVRQALPIAHPTLPDKNEAYIHVDMRIRFSDRVAGSVTAVRPVFTGDHTDETFTLSDYENFIGDAEYDGKYSLAELESGVYGVNDFRIRAPIQVGIQLIGTATTLWSVMSRAEFTSPLEANTEAYPDVYVTELEIEQMSGETTTIDVEKRIPRYDDVCSSVGVSQLVNSDCRLQGEAGNFQGGAMVFSPATIAVEDDQGRITGRIRENDRYVVYDEIPGATYSGPIRHEFVLFPEESARIIVDGKRDGVATVQVDEIRDGRVRTTSYDNIEVEGSTRLVRTMGEDALNVGSTGDGTTDTTREPDSVIERSPAETFESRLGAVRQRQDNSQTDEPGSGSGGYPSWVPIAGGGGALGLGVYLYRRATRDD